MKKGKWFSLCLVIALVSSLMAGYPAMATEPFVEASVLDEAELVQEDSFAADTANATGEEMNDDDSSYVEDLLTLNVEDQDSEEDSNEFNAVDISDLIQTLDEDTSPVSGITLSNTELTIQTKDQKIQLVAMVEPADATDQSVTWTSSKESVVTVDGEGNLTAVKDGTATITVTTTDGGYTAECKVTVSLYSDGFHQEPGGTDWCYYKDGKIATGTTDLIKGTVNGTSGYWNVVKGRVVASATIAKGNVDGTTAWWYVNKKGMVDKSYTGFATNSNGTWYAESGRVTKKTNGVIQDTKGALGSSSAWYYVINSKVQTDFTGLADYSNASGWWYITNGKVDRSVTTVAKNKNGWYYVKNGKVDRSYTGFAKNENGSWYMEKGKLTRKVNGVIKDAKGALGSSNNWYYVLNSKVQTDFTGLADYSNASGWWYITKGKVDRGYTGLAKNKNGWYYITNGKVDRSYTGTAKNSNGWWYAKNGKVDKSAVALVKTNGVWQAYKSGKLDTTYTGLAVNANGWYYVNNGTYVSEKTMTYAARFVAAHSTAGASSSSKLSSCFTYMRNNYNYTRYYGIPKAADLSSCAVDYFTNLTGNCYRYAAAVTCIAKVLGYETRTAVGQVDSGNGLTAHGWCEVKVNGTWYICDVGFNNYMKKQSECSYTLVADNKYELTVSNGKVVWK